jgi:glycosyltransferase involved in cell wall biosynthesis
MIKVCHMTSAHMSDDVRVFQKECVSLARAGYEVYLVACGDSYEEKGVHIIGVGQPSGGRLSRMTSFAHHVYEKALAVDAQIYQFHDPELMPYALKLKRAGKKVIFDSHEMYTEQLRRKPYLPSWITIPMASLYGIYERYVFKKIDGAILPSTKNGVHPFAGKCRHIAIVGNTAVLEELYDRYDPTIPKEENTVCHIGSLTYERGITQLIQASDAAGAVCVLGGDFSPESYWDELKAMPEYRCVRYLGLLNREQVLETLQRSSIGMATLLNFGQYNQYDDLPTKVYEYFSLGLPVILTRCPYNEQVIAKYHCGICVEPDDPGDIAAAIRYLLDHPSEAEKMGENGRRAVKEEFNWGIEEKRLLALYEEILKD